MKLAQVVGQYVTHKQSMGMRFCTEERTLKAFCREIGNIAMTEIQRDQVDAYLVGKGPVTRFWQRKYEVVVGFYRFAIARGYALDIPLPHRVPAAPQRAYFGGDGFRLRNWLGDAVPARYRGCWPGVE